MKTSKRIKKMAKRGDKRAYRWMQAETRRIETQMGEAV